MTISVADECWVTGCRKSATHFVSGHRQSIIACQVHADLLQLPVLAPVPLKHSQSPLPAGRAYIANTILPGGLSISQGGTLARQRMAYAVAPVVNK